MASSDLIKSITRALEIIEYLSESNTALSLDEISSFMQLNSSTTHNILRTLLARGFVEKTQRPVKYKIGAVIEKISSQQQNKVLISAVGESMKKLHNKFPLVRFSFAQGSEDSVIATLRIGPELPGKLKRGNQNSMSPYTSASALVHLARISHRT